MVSSHQALVGLQWFQQWVTTNPISYFARCLKWGTTNRTYWTILVSSSRELTVVPSIWGAQQLMLIQKQTNRQTNNQTNTCKHPDFSNKLSCSWPRHICDSDSLTWYGEFHIFLLKLKDQPSKDVDVSCFLRYQSHPKLGFFSKAHGFRVPHLRTPNACRMFAASVLECGNIGFRNISHVSRCWGACNSEPCPGCPLSEDRSLASCCRV